LGKQKKYFRLEPQKSKFKEVFVPFLDCFVRYKPLSIEELAKLVAAGKDDMERSFVILSALLRPCDPAFTVEAIMEMAPSQIAAISTAISTEENWLGWMKKPPKSNKNTFVM
jgi:hypothetical protein